MSRRNKLEKFADILKFPNVFENFTGKEGSLTGKDGVPVDLMGKWKSDHFKNDNKLVLELACGRGEYTVGLASMYPDLNVIGIDVKGARIWKGATQCLEKGLKNAAFVRTRIEFLDQFFAPGEVDEIWITFPDPFLKKPNRRMTSPFFLNVFRTILKEGGLIHLKTDSPTMYRFSLHSLSLHESAVLLSHTDDLYASPLPAPELGIQTYYERKHLAPGNAIRYVLARMDGGGGF
ncbi:MAG: tRNA (guanosine(46)-N7)-methyltransferase TrmB [Bacteroidetes bacterium]|nr:tRNA (guanosine(46)-N7)-methyltransferase TrmB [Bacteroidota bacterium]